MPDPRSQVAQRSQTQTPRPAALATDQGTSRSAQLRSRVVETGNELIKLSQDEGIKALQALQALQSDPNLPGLIATLPQGATRRFLASLALVSLPKLIGDLRSPEHRLKLSFSLLDVFAGYHAIAQALQAWGCQDVGRELSRLFVQELTPAQQQAWGQYAGKLPKLVVGPMQIPFPAALIEEVRDIPE